MQRDEQLGEPQFAFPSTGRWGGPGPLPQTFLAEGRELHAAPGSGSAGPFCSPGYSLGAVWEPPGTPWLSTRLHPQARGSVPPGSEPGNKSNPIARASAFALGVYGSLGRHQNCVHLPFLPPALFLKHVTSCSGDPAWLGLWGSGERSLRLRLPSIYCPFKISPRSPFTLSCSR